jgi:hypothetical protein
MDSFEDTEVHRLDTFKNSNNIDDDDEEMIRM